MMGAPPSIANTPYYEVLHLLGAALHTIIATGHPEQREVITCNPSMAWNGLSEELQAHYVQAGLAVVGLVLSEPQEWARVLAQTKTALREIPAHSSGDDTDDDGA